MGDMGSGNSASIQSSSTGGGGGGGSGYADDQEYDSRRSDGGASILSFLNNHMPTYSFSSNGSSSFAPPHLPQVGVSNYFSSLNCPTFNNNNNNNNDNNTNNNNCCGNSNCNNDNDNNQFDIEWANKFPSIRPSISTDDTNCTNGPLAYTITNNQQQQSPNPLPLPAQCPPPPTLSSPRSSSLVNGSGRNPKKRSRASRRAPTTVLTTDTTNFRQMVQEFTGIPAPPFTAFSPRTRLGLDLFNGVVSGHTNNSSVVQPPSYLLRPFPQKIAPFHQPHFLGSSTAHNTSSTMSDALGLAMVSTTTTTSPSSALLGTSIISDALGLAAVSTTTTTSLSSALLGTSIISDALGLAAVSTTAASHSSLLLPSNTTSQLVDDRDYQLNFQSFLQSSAYKYSLPALVQQDSSMSFGCTRVASCTDQISGSVNTTSDVIINGALDNIGGVIKGSEGMVDFWICSSD